MPKIDAQKERVSRILPNYALQKKQTTVLPLLAPLLVVLGKKQEYVIKSVQVVVPSYREKTLGVFFCDMTSVSRI